MRHVYRVAILAAAFSQFAPPTMAQQPAAGAAKRVVDPYYAARLAAKEAAGQAGPPSQAATLRSSSEAANLPVAPASALVEGAAAEVQPAAAVNTTTKPVVYDPYYATRQPVRRERGPGTSYNLAAGYEDEGTEGTPAETTTESHAATHAYAMGNSFDGGWDTCPSAPCRTSCLWNEIQSDRCLWGSIEYLSFWVKGNGTPPLVTTSPIGTPQADAGVLGEPTTSILFGGDRLVDGQRNGGRITVGGWWVGDVIGIEGNYWSLGRETTAFRRVSDFSAGLASTDPILARPFTNAALGNAPDSLIVAFPGFIPPVGLQQNVSGRVDSSETSELQSAGLGLRHLLGIDLVHDHRLFLVGGYRFFRLDEDLGIASTIQPMAADVLPGAFIFTNDLFATTNQFHGGDVGLMYDRRFGVWVLQLQGKVALGNMRETVIIDGNTLINDGINETYAHEGLLAQPNIIGFHKQDQFVVIPELDVKLGLQITPALRATAGYNFTYVSRVVRPGNEIDLTINPVTHERPAAPIRPTDLWVQGITAGLELRF